MVTKLGAPTTVRQACEDFADEWLVVKILPHDASVSRMDEPIEVVSSHASSQLAYQKLKKILAINEDRTANFMVIEAVGYITTGEELNEAIKELMTNPAAWAEYERRRRYLWL